MASVFDKVTALAEGPLREFLEREEGPVERALEMVVANPNLSLPLFLSKIFSGTYAAPCVCLAGLAELAGATFLRRLFQPPCPHATRGGWFSRAPLLEHALHSQSCGRAHRDLCVEACCDWLRFVVVLGHCHDVLAASECVFGVHCQPNASGHGA